MLWSVAAAVVDAGAVAPDDSTCLVEAAVRVEELRRDDADILSRLRAVEHCREPAGLHFGVVVEDHKPATARETCAAINTADVAQVLLVANDPCAAYPFEQMLGCLIRRVVHEDDLVSDASG